MADNSDLQQKFLGLQSQRAKAAGKGVMSGIAIEAICAGLILL
jgi:hypothetical protein